MSGLSDSFKPSKSMDESRQRWSTAAPGTEASHSMGALYKSTSLSSPLRPLVSFGRSSSLTAGASMAPPPSPSTDAADSASLSGKLPSFSPVFTSFSRQASMDVQSRSLDLQDVSRADRRAWNGAATGHLSMAASAPLSSGGEADRGTASARSSFAFGEDMETTYRDWHNGVFAALAQLAEGTAYTDNVESVEMTEASSMLRDIEMRKQVQTMLTSVKATFRETK